MTWRANSAPPSAAARPSLRARRRRPFDLRRRQADDRAVAFLHLARDDLREMAVRDARTDPHALRLLRGRIEDVDHLSRTPFAAAAALECAAGAAGSGDAGTAARLRHAPFGCRAAAAAARRFGRTLLSAARHVGG